MTAVDPIIAGAVNFRDIGGLTAGEQRTRAGVLYRSGNLAQLDGGGVAALGALGIRRIIDLREDDEVASAPSRIDGLELSTQRVPLFLGSVASFFAEDISLDEMYRRLIDESAERIVEVVRGIVVDQPVLVHCAIGKDRTGVTIAITLAAAGVDEEAIVADYARTEGMLSARRNERVLAHLRAMHPGSVHLEELATRSPASVMRRLLAGIVARHGSVADYLRAHGLTDDELVELRQVLIVAD